MIDGKLTHKDITEYCCSHYCNEYDCEYMKGYCRIREFSLEECNDCVDRNCRSCKNYK